MVCWVSLAVACLWIFPMTKMCLGSKKVEQERSNTRTAALSNDINLHGSRAVAATNRLGEKVWLACSTRFVNQSQESLEAGLCRELMEEVGVALSVSEDDHVDARRAPGTSPSCPRLITHFYVKKLEEEQIREVEKASASTAKDHGQEVLGMVRVPLYTTKGGGGLPSFLSHAFIGNARSQLVHSLLRLRLVAPEDLRQALERSLKTHARSAADLQEALALTEAEQQPS
ncbi:U8 snoRNA-decapping enzyme isoform X1 [Entelurus aequoreus]|uniref:U8 snoRNA-decapping enzyme isoform X1 n=1 Tax=Entelurus aequoreus TaxID=161455 RepID=UPI002B1D8891|nr:U8 snoRNA-decapping enzyme isoform X1 [Entelurus aequoreus]